MTDSDDTFDRAFDPPTPGTTGVPAAQSVQSSLYLRLKKSRGDKAGAIGWLLVRAGQPEHPRNAAALAALASQGSGLESLLATARATRAAPAVAGKLASRELAQAVVDAIQDLIAARNGAAVFAAMPDEERAAMHAKWRETAKAAKP